MAYCKKWIPPTIPLRNDLPAWKTLFTDLHDSIITAGLVQTDTVGQLDFDDVTVLPVDNTYAGFREYAFNDALQETAPVLLRLEFGCGIEGLYSSSTCRDRTPRIRAKVLFLGQESSSFTSPQDFNRSGSTTSQLQSEGVSYISHNPSKGFFGLVYGAGSRNKPFAHITGGYYGATFSLFVQRTVDSSGLVTDEGVMVYGPNLIESNSTNQLWANSNLDPGLSQYIGNSGAADGRTDLAMRLGGNANAVVDGDISVQQIFCMSDKKPLVFPWIVTYASELNAPSIPEGTEFMLEVYPGTESRFIAVGNETSISTGYPSYQRAGIAMLFEGD